MSRKGKIYFGFDFLLICCFFFFSLWAAVRVLVVERIRGDRLRNKKRSI